MLVRRLLARLDEARHAPETKPTEPTPVLGPAVDEQGDLRPLQDVPYPLEVVGIDDALRLLVERRMEHQAGRLRDHEADRHESRYPAVVDRREDGGPSGHEERQFGRTEKWLGRHRPMMHPWAMAGRTIVRGMLVLAVAVGFLTGCDDAESVGPAAIHDLGEPWQARPFAVDPAVIAAAEQVCRDPVRQMVPAAISLVLVDARGDNRLTLLFAGPRETSQCFLTRDCAGQLTFGGGEGSGGDVRPALGPTEISFQGAGSEGDPVHPTSHGAGRVGVGVASVELIPPSGVTVQASLNQGWFAAWWYGLDHDGVIAVRAYDAMGRLVASQP